jgi:hypothetical protein
MRYAAAQNSNATEQVVRVSLKDDDWRVREAAAKRAKHLKATGDMGVGGYGG